METDANSYRPEIVLASYNTPLDSVVSRPLFEPKQNYKERGHFLETYLKTQMFLYSNEIPASCVRNSTKIFIDESYTTKLSGILTRFPKQMLECKINLTKKSITMLIGKFPFQNRLFLL